MSQLGGTRWDRPMVRVAGSPARSLDLMIQENGRFLKRIRGTALYCGQTNDPSKLLEEESPTSEATLDDLAIQALPEDALLDDAPRPTNTSVDKAPDLLQVPLHDSSDFDENIEIRTAVDAYTAPEPLAPIEDVESSLAGDPTMKGEPPDFDFDATKTQEMPAPDLGED